MFGEMTFAGGTFSDLFPAPFPVVYIFRYGRTAVYVYPEDDIIVSGVSSTRLATKVEAVELDEPPTFVQPKIRLRTKVELIDDSEVPTIIKPYLILRTKVEAVPEETQSVVEALLVNLRTKVESINEETSSVSLDNVLKSDVTVPTTNI